MVAVFFEQLLQWQCEESKFSSVSDERGVEDRTVILFRSAACM